MGTRELQYTIIDVFAEEALAGNPLAVFHDASGITEETMQALARETNLAETTFIIPDKDDPDRDAREGVRVRIFTPEEELPFAGHPTLGTATWLHLHYPVLKSASVVKLRLKVGTIPVTFSEPHGSHTSTSIVRVFGTMRQNDPVFGQEHDAAEVASVLELDLADFMFGYSPQTVSTGNAFCIVPLHSLQALAKLAVPPIARQWLKDRNIRWFYCVAPTGRGDEVHHVNSVPAWRARMQFFGGEDPATGSAAGPCIAWLVKSGLAVSGREVILEQGVEMLRPSRLFLKATKSSDGAITDVTVGGHAIPVAEGRFRLPILG